MIIGITVNIIFLNLFFAWFAYYKRNEKEAIAKAKFRGELRKIIDNGLKDIKLESTWQECKPDTLLDWYIHQDEIYIEDLERLK